MRFTVTRTSGYDDGAENPLDWDDRAVAAPLPECRRELVDGAQSPGWGYRWVLEMETLEELLALQQRARHPLILSKPERHDPLPNLEVWDDYH